MDRLNKEYIELLNQNVSASEKFWALDKRIKADKKKVGVQLELRRSTFISNLISHIHEDVIHFDNLEEFSSELQGTVKLFVER